MHAIYNTLGFHGGIGSHECMLFTAPCPPRDGSDRQGSDECMLFTALWVLSVVSDQGNKECMLFTIPWAPREVSEATIVCYLQHVGPPGRYRRPRLHAIYDTLGPQGGIGGQECMLFTTRWAPREESEATIVCYVRHVGPPGRYRRPRLYAIYDTLGPQGGIGPPGGTSYGPRFGVIFIGVEPTRPAHS